MTYLPPGADESPDATNPLRVFLAGVDVHFDGGDAAFAEPVEAVDSLHEGLLGVLDGSSVSLFRFD